MGVIEFMRVIRMTFWMRSRVSKPTAHVTKDLLRKYARAKCQMPANWKRSQGNDGAISMHIRRLRGVGIRENDGSKIQAVIVELRRANYGIKVEYRQGYQQVTSDGRWSKQRRCRPFRSWRSVFRVIGERIFLYGQPDRTAVMSLIHKEKIPVLLARIVGSNTRPKIAFIETNRRWKPFAGLFSLA